MSLHTVVDFFKLESRNFCKADRIKEALSKLPVMAVAIKGNSNWAHFDNDYATVCFQLNHLDLLPGQINILLKMVKESESSEFDYTNISKENPNTFIYRLWWD